MALMSIDWDKVADAISNRILKGKTPGEDIAASIKKELLEDQDLKKFINEILDERQESLKVDIKEIVRESISEMESHASKLTTKIETSIDSVGSRLKNRIDDAGGNIAIKTGSEMTKAIVIAAVLFGLITGALVSVVLVIK